MAEALLDLERTLQQARLSTTAYDKRLYDRLQALQAPPVREHLCAGLDYQDRLRAFWRTTTSRRPPPLRRR